jgi:hypothetical protein
LVTLAKREIIIEPDYWLGGKTLANGVPWMVPGAIHAMDRLLRPDDVVLEVGTGGSTLFFAERCQRVIAIETSEAWAQDVVLEMEDRQIRNVEYYLRPTQEAVESKVASLTENLCSVVSIDSVSGFDRSRFLTLSLLINPGPQLRMVVMDNYSDATLFLKHHSLSEEEMQLSLGVSHGRWRVETYNDNRWFGSGTRLFIREKE